MVCVPCIAPLLLAGTGAGVASYAEKSGKEFMFILGFAMVFLAVVWWFTKEDKEKDCKECQT